MRFLPFCLAICPAATLSACGNSRVTPPDVAAPQPPQGMHLASYPRSGVSVVIPDNWRAEEGASPLVTSIALGDRHGGHLALPPHGAAAAQRRGVPARQARARPCGAEARQDTPGRDGEGHSLRGRPALQIVGVETVAGVRRMVRSTHVFRDRSEVVVEALAPPAAFGGLERTVFDPLLRSLVIRPLPP